jgi:transmembrane sensor
MNNLDIEDLVNKFFLGTLTLEEKEKLNKWYRDTNDAGIEWESSETEDVLKNRLFNQIDKDLKLSATSPIKKYSLWSKLAVASILITVLSFSVYFYNQKTNLNTPVNNKHAQVDFNPGSAKAYLTLADGSRVILDDKEIGYTTTQSGTIIKKTNKGQIVYTTKLSDSSSNQYNTIEIPMGGKYQIVLPDGSKVWLNSATTLRFPVNFSKKVREVELKGEAYFEIVKKIDLPFKVISKNHLVEVLGTHFNVNAYNDESSIKTTLLEGKVRVSNASNKNTVILKPGEQSKYDNTFTVAKVDSQISIAWKEGYFRFDNADLNSVMRQLSRWYGVKIRYERDIPKLSYGGAIDMNLTLLQVMEILKNSKINLSLDGNVLVVES